jgi:uncharacterized damage-inducible protein DinB
MSRALVPQTFTPAVLSLLEQLKVVVFASDFSGFEHFQRRFSRFVVKSAAVTPGRGFGFAAATAGFTENRIERLTTADKKGVRLFMARIFPYLLPLQSHKLLCMTITLETMLGHMAWANQQIFTQISELPDEALGAYVTHENWDVAEILFHTIVSADRLVFRINARDITQMSKPTNMKELKVLINNLKKFDEELLALVNEPDRIVEVNRSGVLSYWHASTILSQAVHHVIEHKCQAVTALEFRGFKAPDLDDYDVWGYERSIK